MYRRRFAEDYDLARCKHCGIEGSIHEVTAPGHDHRIKQGCFRRGFVPGADGRMCCERAEGAAFKCGKAACPVEFVVAFGFVWALEPNQIITDAHRGKDHCVNHRCSHHDYPCDMYQNGMRNVGTVMQLENAKARRLFDSLATSRDARLDRFARLAEKLVDILPAVEGGKVLQIGCPALSSQPLDGFKLFHDTASIFDCRQAYKQMGACSEVLNASRTLVRYLHRVRCVRGQVGIQKLKHSGNLVDKILGYLGRQEFLPRISGFDIKEVDVPAVIQEVQHADPAAVVDDMMAAMNLEHKTADNVAALSETREPGRTNVGDAAEDVDRIHLLQYNRHPEAWRKALCEGGALRQCREALEEVGRKWLLGSDAKMFVHPHQVEAACVAIVEKGIDLRPFHVIVSESLEHALEACLNDLACRQGARVKERMFISKAASADVVMEDPADDGTPDDAKMQHSPEDGDEISVESEAVEFTMEPKRTFLCLCETTRLRNPQSVTQSTTEANSTALNPRRVNPLP
eukprot:TRINITY_DN122908_c0_g1_i1.p1 TRINITY_DN122908_c0_g1~~TRINITY_DN122908_c0_g1_i1.p1  ORF type:complete len:516 (-),score=72.59 TRINITY_DN122908_c0_g1_i1:545-2092(-)